jgi:transposase
MEANNFINDQIFHVEARHIDVRELIDQLVHENVELRTENQNLRLQIEAQNLLICQLRETIHLLQERVKELEGRLAKNSQNSSKPPGLDGLKKPKTRSQREASGKKPGGQFGRVGKNLKLVEVPDHVIVHTPDRCINCACSLCNVEGVCEEKRQVFDIPKPTVEVTEHRIESKVCPYCGEISRSVFPEDVSGLVQYGERVQALSTYLRNEHLIPIERVCEIFEDILGISLSAGTCSKIDKNLFDTLAPFEIALKVHLLATKVLHFDETGMRCEKKMYWVHVTASKSATFYGIHPKRGKQAIDEFDILPQFKDTACHDHWFPYFAYTQTKHSLCNAHHLRELTYIYEQEKEAWGKEMIDLLLLAKEEVETYANANFDNLPNDVRLKIEEEYTRIIDIGFKYHQSLPELPKGKRGKQKQRIGKNLLDRFKEKQDCVFRFMYDFSVPFTNNLAEQALRMMKVKLKISGCFRTHEGGEIFCRIRSYIATARKQGWKIWDSLVDAIKGCPRSFRLPA